MQRPPRTLGISFAILASACLFSCLPLTQATFWLLAESRLRSQVALANPNTALQPLFAGGSVLGLDPARVAVQALLAIVFLMITVLAWRGGIPIIRHLLVIAVLVLSSGNIWLLLNTILTTPTLDTGLDSASDAGRAIAGAQLGATVLVTLYVLWYLNRGPARAFFRGYFLPTPGTIQAHTEKEAH